jgi:signal transduction histidine kinase
MSEPAKHAPLTSAQQVLDLGVDAARRLVLPVHLQGLVTYPDPGVNLIYVQDSSAGILVSYTNANYQPASGQMVMVEGIAAGGTFAPFVDCANVRVAGSSLIPEPCEAPAARMAAGELFGQWVQIEGVVRDVAREPSRAILFVSSGGQRFHAVIQPFLETAAPVEWLEARVLLRGVCWTDVDAETKPIGFTLFVPGTNCVSIVRPGERNLFDRPGLPANLHPELHRQSDSRVKVTGVVTYQSPSGYVYLESEGGPIRARLLVPLARGNPQGRYYERPPNAPLRPGTRVELLGAPTATMYSPLLQDAEFRSVGESMPPVPATVNAGEALSGKHDAELVSIKARVLAAETRPIGVVKQQVFALQAGDSIFEALWEFTGTNTLPLPRKNSHVLATGICNVQLGELNQIRSFRLLLREPGDLCVVGSPPWWETLPLGKILVVIITVGAVGACWIWLLRRQVSQRTAQLRAEVAERQRAQSDLHRALEAERELSEFRSRFVSLVSHEFRTPLGVILSAAENLNTYFERLDPAQRRKQLDHVIQGTDQMARVMENVLLLSRAEAGKIEFKPGQIDLASFCEQLAGQVQTSTGARCPIHFHTEVTGPGKGDEALLRHILTNVLANAVKYSANGQAVQFTLARSNGHAVFRVQDQGIGIPLADQKQLFNAFHRATNASHLPGTGLGLVIVKRCVELHGGQITCESQQNSGTSFTIRIPLFETPGA